MKHLIASLFVISLCLLFSNHAQASFQSDVTNCLKINNSNDRLDCYDTVVKYYKLNSSSAAEHTKTTSEPSSPITAPLNPNTVNVPIASPALAEQSKPTKKITSSDEFGLIEAQTEGAVESIQSRLIGEFSGWVKGKILKLENGQKWKITSVGKGFKRMDGPVITITRGFFGSFNAKVEGLNGGAKVKRVK